MVSPLAIGAAVVVGLIFLRLIFGGKSSYNTRHSAVKSAESQLRKVEAYENRINTMQRSIRTSPNDKAREMAAKKLERMLRQKERLKLSAERSTKKS